MADTNFDAMISKDFILYKSGILVTLFLYVRNVENLPISLVIYLNTLIGQKIESLARLFSD